MMKLATALIGAALTLSAFAAPQSVAGEKLNELLARDERINELLRRQDPISDIIEIAVGIWVAIEGESAAGTAIGDIIQAIGAGLGDAFGVTDPWNNHNNCRLKWSTHSGSNCSVTTFPAPSSGNSSSDANMHIDDWNVCPWINPSSTAPPTQYFTDPGIGDYSIQFAATDTVAWIDQTAPKNSKCAAQGLCHPIFRFYRNGWNLIMQTWLLGTDDDEGFPDEYVGLCAHSGGNYDEFHKNGDVISDTCAIPCWNQIALPSPESTS